MNTFQFLTKRLVIVSAAGIAALGIAGIALAQTATTTPSGPPTCTLSLNPTSLTPGQTATLSWTSSNATQGSIDQGVGNLGSVNGSTNVTPASTLTYTGTFSGAEGTTTCATTALTVEGLPPAVMPSVPTVTTPTTTTPIPTATITPTSISPVAYPAAGTTPAPMVVQIDDSGNALIRGTVQSVGSNTITIDSWGGVWIVNTNGASSVTPAGPNGSGDVSGIQAGDFVGVDGTLDQSQIYTVDASVVRDWTTDPSSSLTTTSTDTSSSTTGVSSAPAQILYTGSASNVSGDSFTLTDDSGNVYTVTTDANTVMLDSNGNSIALTDIQDGDAMRLDGNLGGTTSTISASVVRDTSLPTGSTGASSTTDTTNTAPAAAPAPAIPTGTSY